MFYIALAVIDAALWALFRWTKAHLEHPFAKLMWSVHGPRTDVRYMNRAQLFGSARIFVAWGLILFITHAAFLAAARNSLAESVVLASLWGAVMLSSLLGLAGGLYLLLRAIARPSSYLPPPAPEPRPSL